MAIVTSPTGSTTPASILASAKDWRVAVSDLITFLVANDRCFSSGEISALLRTHRPDFAFKVSNVGDYIRDHYDNGNFPSYVIQGVSEYPTQVPRISTGQARTLDGRAVVSKTPVGQALFVYAPNGAEGFAHDFEVFIPDFDDPQAFRAQSVTASTPPPVQAAPAPTVPVPQNSPVGVLITGTLKRDDVEAYVRPDRRLCVPRAAFEAFVALTQIPLRGGPQGDPVHLRVTVDNKIRVTRQPETGSTPYHLWGARGRLAFVSPTGTPYEPGDKYGIVVDADALTIDLSKTL